MQATAQTKTSAMIEAYARNGDRQLLARLVSDYTPLVRRICRRFHRSREAPEDLFQIGVIGLLSAIGKFDPRYGTSLASLAIPEILGAILNHLRDHGNLLKIPRVLRKNKLAHDKAAERLAVSQGRWPTIEELGEECELSERQVLDAMEFGRKADPRSLDEMVGEEDSDGGICLSDCVGVCDAGFDRTVDNLTLASVLNTLPDREQNILRLKFYHGLSQRQIAERIRLSQMQVSRLQRSALKRLRQLMDGPDAPSERPISLTSQPAP